MVRNFLIVISIAGSGLVYLVGCGNGKTNTATADAPPAAAQPFLLTTEPTGAKNVTETREHVQNDEEIVIVGKIGGELNPWIEGLAAFKIADLSRQPCSEKPGDDCPTPWDYCCEKDMPTSVALVQIENDKGQVVEIDAKKTLGFKELQTIVVQGKAERDDKQNLVVHAKKVFIRK